jgi:hypothetical protein
MEYTTYASRLRFLRVEDVDCAVVDCDDLQVRGADGTPLGRLEGFVVDAEVARLYYAVIDSGGWFPSRSLLLPIGHASLERDRSALTVDLTREVLSRYPSFDADRFRTFSDEDLWGFEARTAEACCPGAMADGATADSRRHFVQPHWWNGSAVRKDRLRTVHGAQPPQAAPTARPATGLVNDAPRPQHAVRLSYSPGGDRPGQSER